jgi:hypothetical protein
LQPQQPDNEKNAFRRARSEFSEKGFLGMLASHGRHNMKTTMLFIVLAVVLSTALLFVYANGNGCVIGCESDFACDDGNPDTLDVCNNDGACDSSCTHINQALDCEVECSSDAQCDDSNPDTMDVCNNDKTCQAACANIRTSSGSQSDKNQASAGQNDKNQGCTIACNSDSECDDQDQSTIDVCDSDASCESECVYSSLEPQTEPLEIQEIVEKELFDGCLQKTGFAVDGANTTEVDLQNTTMIFLGNHNDCVSLPKEDGVGGKQAWTISLWFNTQTKHDNGLYLEDYYKNEGSGQKFSYVTIDLYNSIGWGVYTEVYNSITGEKSFIGGEGINQGYNDGQWHHLAWTRNGSNWALYLDGILAGTNSNYVTPIAAKPDFVHIGEGYSGFLDTEVENFKVYDKALNAQEINQQYKLEIVGK